MSKIDDGGPAFPWHSDGCAENIDPSPGMTLRDYFAGQALAGLIAHQGLTAHIPHAAMTPIQKSIYEIADGHPQDGEFGNLSEAIAAYEVADAMLAARKAVQP